MNNTLSELKKELNWNNVKIAICGFVPMAIGGWAYVQWINLLTPIMNKFSSTIGTIATPEQAIISLCLVMGLVFPIWPLLLWTCYGGLWLGKVTRFFKDSKTKYLMFDDVSYLIKDMPEEEREQIKQILSSYKSKRQIRKEKLANKSWIWRNLS